MERKQGEHGLTAKQEHFARLVSAGETLSDAYRASYNAENMTNEAIHSNAYKLSKHTQVKLRIDALVVQRMQEIERKGVSDRDEVARLAKEFARDDGKPDAVRLRALELWGRTCGAFIEVIEYKRDRPAAVVAADIERRMAALLEGLNASGQGEGDSPPSSTVQ